MATASTTRMTVEEFLALPEEDGVYRELVDGELREYPMTTRNTKHSLVTGNLTYFLSKWLREETDEAGVVPNGDTRCRLASDSDTVVGIDVALFIGEEFVAMAQRIGTYEGPPVIAVEVLSPTDTQENVSEKIRLYLDANVKQVWIADPEFDAVTVHRPGVEHVLFTRSQLLTGEPDLPGFQVKVAEVFKGIPSRKP